MRQWVPPLGVSVAASLIIGAGSFYVSAQTDDAVARERIAKHESRLSILEATQQTLALTQERLAATQEALARMQERLDRQHEQDMRELRERRR